VLGHALLALRLRNPCLGDLRPAPELHVEHHDDSCSGEGVPGKRWQKRKEDGWDEREGGKRRAKGRGRSGGVL
jgi:hypothetical protein